MKTGIVKLKDMQNMRFDASFHMSDGVQYKRIIFSSPYKSLQIGDVAERIFYGLRANRIYVKNKNHAIPFMTGANIMLSDLNKNKLVSKKYTPSIEEMTLHPGWILVTRSGTVGQTAWSNKLFEGKYGSEDIIRIVPNGKMKGGLIYAYLASKYGNVLLTQGSFGAVIQHIEPTFVSSIIIPDFPESFQQKVDNLIQESARLREEATEALEEAKEKLQYYIKDNFKKNNYKTEIIEYQDIIQSLQYRIDPPALMNDGVQTMKAICKNYPHKRIAEIDGKVYRPGIFKRIYVEKGLPYIKGSEIFLANPFRRCVSVSRSKTPFIDEMRLREGQIMITCAGSVGDIKMITKEYEEKDCIGSQDIIRLESNDSLYTREYLFIYLQLPFVYDYMQSMKYGSVIERLEPFHIESIPVVKPTEDISKEISNIVQSYMDKTYNAFKAEESAIQMVEQEIESWK